MSLDGFHVCSEVNVRTFTDREVDHLDYQKRFRPDEKGKEKEPNARVWRVYLNEAGQFDLNMIENMRDTVDVFFVFVSGSSHLRSGNV